MPDAGPRLNHLNPRILRSPSHIGDRGTLARRAGRGSLSVTMRLRVSAKRFSSDHTWMASNVEPLGAIYNAISMKTRLILGSLERKRAAP